MTEAQLWTYLAWTAEGSSHYQPEDGYRTYIPSHSLVFQDLSPSSAGRVGAIVLSRGDTGKDGAVKAGTEMLSQCLTSKIDVVQLICVHIERNTQHLNENFHLVIDKFISRGKNRKYPV